MLVVISLKYLTILDSFLSRRENWKYWNRKTNESLLWQNQHNGCAAHAWCLTMQQKVKSDLSREENQKAYVGIYFKLENRRAASLPCNGSCIIFCFCSSSVPVYCFYLNSHLYDIYSPTEFWIKLWTCNL